MYRGGGSFHLTAPPKHAGSPLSTEHRERGLLLHLTCCLRVQYDKFSSNCWCVIGVWHEAMQRTYMHDYGTCRSVHQCPCGRWMHGFCGRGIGEEGYGQQRECTDCQKITRGDKTASLSSPMELSEEEGGGGRRESCITSSITEAEVHSRFEEIRSCLYSKGGGGEYS